MWSGAAHGSRELSKCLCSSQHLMGRLRSRAKHTAKMESRLLRSPVGPKDKMYVNVRKEKSLKDRPTSRRNLSNGGNQRLAEFGCHGGASLLLHPSPSRASGGVEPFVSPCRPSGHEAHMSHGSCGQAGSIRNHGACWRPQPLRRSLLPSRGDKTERKTTVWSLALYAISEEQPGNPSGVSDTGERHPGFGSGTAW